MLGFMYIFGHTITINDPTFRTHVDPEGLDIEMGGMGDMGEAFEFGGPGFGGEGFAADNVDAFPAGQASPVHSRIHEEVCPDLVLHRFGCH